MDPTPEHSAPSIPGLELAADLEEADLGADIHARAIIIDGHNDALMAVADRKTTLTERFRVPDRRSWRPPAGLPSEPMDAMYGFSAHTSWFQTMGFYDIPRALEGGVTSQAFSIYLQDKELDRPLHRAFDMIAGLYEAADRSAAFSIVRTVADIRAAKVLGRTSGYLTFEGFEPLGYNLSHLRLFHELGLRMATLTHNRRNAFADGNNQPGGTIGGGLTQLGKDAVREMDRLGIVIDLAHMNLRGAWEIVERSENPVVISHALAEQYHAPGSGLPSEADLDTRKRLWDRIAARGGVIGAIAWSRQTLAGFVDGIDQIVAAVGIDHVGLGTDFFGMEFAPAGFEGMHEMPNVTAELIRRGYREDSILKILGQNYLRVFGSVW